MIKKKLLLYAVIFTAFFALPVSAKDYKGAEFRTKLAYTYGRFEVRMKTSEREGMLASFFTYHDYSSGGSENWNEIDIEVLGRYSDDVQFNVISPGQTNHVRHEHVPFNPASDFHVYAFEWTPNYVSWFIDGVEVYKQTGAHIAQLNKAQKIMMNIWNQGYPDWSGTFNPANLPAFAYYDYVQYSSYTPGTGSSGTGNNFTFLWKDDFNSWDQTRWEKATHTFTGNLCDFVHANAVFKDGNLVLCLTDATNLGLTDKTAPVPLWARHDSLTVTIRFGEEVEKASAENLTNYILPGVTVSSALLGSDNKTVTLQVNGLLSTATYQVVIRNVKDLAQPANLSATKSLNIANPPNVTFPLKINVGGSAILGYVYDQGWVPTGAYGYLDGSVATYPGGTPIANTTDDIIFLSDRYNMARYYVRVPNGTYNLKLLFAENYFTAAGKRVFDVFVNGVKAVQSLDIYQQVGKNAALIKEIKNLVVTDGFIELGMAALVENPLLNGIIIEKGTTGLLEEMPDAGKKQYTLHQNYPNPFNPKTKIGYRLSASANVRLKVFSSLGEEIAEPVNQYQAAGEYQVDFPSVASQQKHLATGCYFYQLIVDNRSSEIKKMIVLN